MYSFWFAHCTRNETHCVVTCPTLCPCLWDQVTMLTECPTPERAEPRVTLGPDVTSAAPCLKQSRCPSKPTAHSQQKCQGFSWNGLPCLLLWSSSLLLEEISWSFSLYHSKESFRTPPTFFCCLLLWLICWWGS